MTTNTAEPIYEVAAHIGRWAIGVLRELPRQERIGRLAMALDAVRPSLSNEVTARAARLRNEGYPVEAALERAIGAAMAGHMIAEVARWVAPLECTKASMGLGHCSVHCGALGDAPPTATANEQDEIVQHNIPPSPKAPRERIEWEARQYRGLWYPAFMTPIASLTADDVGLASAFLAGRLTTKGCPQSDKAKKEQDEKNKVRRGYFIFEQIAGVIATAVMSVFFTALGGVLTSLLHRAKVALIEHLWKEKIVRDPSIKLLLDKLSPTGPYSYMGYRYWLRPYGNMLLKELGCGADLQTRLLLHGRMLRTLDVMVASSPKAGSHPGLYDYPSAFGMLRGSIFPPRGTQLDGVPAGPHIVAQVKKIIATPPIQAAIARPAASLSAQAEALVTPRDFPTPEEALKSAAAVRSLVEKQQAKVVAITARERPVSKHWPVLVIGGVALGAALLASRDRT